jgi:hypothetical protein
MPSWHLLFAVAPREAKRKTLWGLAFSRSGTKKKVMTTFNGPDEVE